MDLKKYIGIYDNVLEYKILSNFLKYCNSVNFEQAEIIGENGKGKKNLEIRKTKEKNLSNFGVDSLTEIHWANYLTKVFIEVTRYYKNEKKFIKCPTGTLSNISILKYEEGGFYKWHVDHAMAVPRTISLIFLLNNDYEGGHLSFAEGDGTNEITIENKPNRIIAWPSNFLYPHSVKPVTKGIRYSLVCWVL